MRNSIAPIPKFSSMCDYHLVIGVSRAVKLYPICSSGNILYIRHLFNTSLCVGHPWPSCFSSWTLNCKRVLPNLVYRSAFILSGLTRLFLLTAHSQTIYKLFFYTRTKICIHGEVNAKVRKRMQVETKYIHYEDICRHSVHECSY